MMKNFFIIGSLLGALSVVLGAFGAHALTSILDNYAISLWDKANYYQMIHSIMIIITSLSSIYANQTKRLTLAAFCFLFGIILFSGSLYTIALTGIKSFGIIAPFGGVSFILGWVILMTCFNLKKSA